MPTEFDFNQSSEQMFFFFINAEIDGEPLEVGEFRLTPQITVEAHGGFENNIEGKPDHMDLMAY